jgi:peptidoglycan/LPS O-acetylase OafA/YrhL
MPQLDGLRAFAVAGVLFAHFMPASLVDRIDIPFGTLGVTLFFVLSGFLISEILLKQKSTGAPLSKNLETFYIRRFLRIFPIYYLLLVVLVVINFPGIHDNFAWHFFYLTNVKIALYGWDAYISYFWTLAVEEQFYLVFPLLLFTVPYRYIPALLVCTALCGPAYRLVTSAAGSNVGMIYTQMPSCLDAFSLGGLLAFAKLKGEVFYRAVLQRISTFIIPVALVFTGLLIFRMQAGEQHLIVAVLFRLVFSLLCMYLIGRASLGFTGAGKALLQNPLVLYTGRISYGIYLFHGIIPYLFRNMEAPFYVTFLLYTSVTLVLASASWHLIEKPVNGLKNRFSYGIQK